MLFCVYIIYSSSLDQYYIGHSENLQDRLFRDKNLGSKSTKKTNDWELVYHKTFQTRAEAVRREMVLHFFVKRNFIVKIERHIR